MQLTADEVLRTFHHDEVALFLGSAFATIGLIAIAVLLIRRKFDAMLFWLGLLAAILYGSRLWTQSGLLALMVPPSDFFDRLRAASNFIVAIPALFFFALPAFWDASATWWLTRSALCWLSCCCLPLLALPCLRSMKSTTSPGRLFALLALVVQSFRQPENRRLYSHPPRPFYLSRVCTLQQHSQRPKNLRSG